MKNIVIGCIDRYNWNQIKNWVLSLNEQSPLCTKIMLVYNIDNDCINKLKQHKFTVYQSNLNSQIVVQRFYDMWKILSIIDLKDNEWLLTTDVKDVVFQSCPFEWLNQKASGFDLISSSENITYENEQWSKNNVLQCFGKNITNMMLSSTIYNAGVMAGKASFLKDLFLINYLMCLGSKSYNPDQTTYNILLETLLKYCKVYKPTEKDCWAAQIGTTLDSSKNYRIHNLEPIPTFDNKTINNSLNIPYPIVHQYDRNPEFNNFFNKQYE